MSKLETNTIDTVSGTSTLQVGSTNTSTITLGVSGDTVNVPSGVTINNNGTQTGFGGVMTPAFFARLSSNQTITDATTTKINFNSEGFDTNNAFDNSTNYRFTPQVSGKYFIASLLKCNAGDTNLDTAITVIKKNGSDPYQYANFEMQTGGTNRLKSFSAYYATIIELNGSSDYVEGYAYIDDTSGNPTVESGSFLMGYKIIE